jgi:hypothetical protein
MDRAEGVEAVAAQPAATKKKGLIGKLFGSGNRAPKKNPKPKAPKPAARSKSESGPAPSKRKKDLGSPHVDGGKVNEGQSNAKLIPAIDSTVPESLDDFDIDLDDSDFDDFSVGELLFPSPEVIKNNEAEVEEGGGLRAASVPDGNTFPLTHEKNVTRHLSAGSNGSSGDASSLVATSTTTTSVGTSTTPGETSLSSAPASGVVTGRPPILLHLSCDYVVLSDYQVLIRRQIELFETTMSDLLVQVPSVKASSKKTVVRRDGVGSENGGDSGTSPTLVVGVKQGRNKPIQLGQVGIRCSHCRNVPIHLKTRGSTYYPSKLTSVYQAAQNMATLHFLGSGDNHCPLIPAHVRTELEQLQPSQNKGEGRIKETKGASSVRGTGKHCWAERVAVLGVEEDELAGLLRYKPSPWTPPVHQG